MPVILIFAVFVVLIILVVFAVAVGGIGMRKEGPPPESGSAHPEG